MSYIDFKIDYDVPFGRMSTLYENLGINKALEERKKELDFPDPDSWLLPPRLIKCNKKTQEKLLHQWMYNWKNYNYDHRSGLPKRNKLVKYVRARGLSEDDRDRIQFNFYLGDGPSQDNEVPDDIIRLDLDFTFSDATKRGEN